MRLLEKSHVIPRVMCVVGFYSLIVQMAFGDTDYGTQHTQLEVSSQSDSQENNSSNEVTFEQSILQKQVIQRINEIKDALQKYDNELGEINQSTSQKPKSKEVSNETNKEDFEKKKDELSKETDKLLAELKDLFEKLSSLEGLSHLKDPGSVAELKKDISKYIEQLQVESSITKRTKIIEDQLKKIDQLSENEVDKLKKDISELRNDILNTVESSDSAGILSNRLSGKFSETLKLLSNSENEIKGLMVQAPPTKAQGDSSKNSNQLEPKLELPQAPKTHQNEIESNPTAKLETPTPGIANQDPISANSQSKNIFNVDSAENRNSIANTRSPRPINQPNSNNEEVNPSQASEFNPETFYGRKPITGNVVNKGFDSPWDSRKMINKTKPDFPETNGLDDKRLETRTPKNEVYKVPEAQLISTAGITSLAQFDLSPSKEKSKSQPSLSEPSPNLNFPTNSNQTSKQNITSPSSTLLYQGGNNNNSEESFSFRNRQEGNRKNVNYASSNTGGGDSTSENIPPVQMPQETISDKTTGSTITPGKTYQMVSLDGSFSNLQEKDKPNRDFPERNIATVPTTDDYFSNRNKRFEAKSKQSDDLTSPDIEPKEETSIPSPDTAKIQTSPKTDTVFEILKNLAVADTNNSPSLIEKAGDSPNRRLDVKTSTEGDTEISKPQVKVGITLFDPTFWRRVKTKILSWF